MNAYRWSRSTTSRFLKWCLLVTLCFGVALAIVPGPIMWVDDLDFFELEGDAAANDPGAGPDWDTVTEGAGANQALVFTGIVPDFTAPDRELTGGKSKDVWDMALWQHQIAAPVSPDKDNITNAYAAAFSVDHDNMAGTPPQLWIAFGADRFANDGSASIGFTFRQSTLAVNTSTGMFDGESTVGDVVVIADFQQGGALSSIQVFEVTAIAGNGKLTLSDLTGGLSWGECDPTAPSHDVCARSNKGLAPIAAPWTYFFKGVGMTNQFPQNTFFEGAINMSAVFQTVPCFSSFMAETRTSGNSVNATLKDFVLGNLEVCPFSVEKVCGTSVIANVGGTEVLQYPVTIKLINGGFGTVSVISHSDVATLSDTTTVGKTLHQGTPAFNESPPAPTNLLPATPFDIGPGTTMYSGHMDHVTNPSTTVTSNKFTATISLGDGVTKTEDFTATCSQGQFGAITAFKECSVPVPTLNQAGTALEINVDVKATVCNPSNVTLTNVSATDDEAGALKNNGSTTTTLGPGTQQAPTCKEFTGSYTPTVCEQSGQPGRCTFSDQLTQVSGTVQINGASVSVPAQSLPNASCKLCPDGTCPDSPQPE